MTRKKSTRTKKKEAKESAAAASARPMPEAKSLKAMERRLTAQAKETQKVRAQLKELARPDGPTQHSLEFVRQTLAPDELDERTEFLCAPTAELGPRFACHTRTMQTLTFTNPSLLINAPGSTLYVLQVNELEEPHSSTAPVSWAREPVAGDGLTGDAVLLGSSRTYWIALNMGSKDLYWTQASTPAGPSYVTEGGDVYFDSYAKSEYSAAMTSVLQPAFHLGAHITQTLRNPVATAAEVPVPTARTITGNLWFPCVGPGLEVEAEFRLARVVEQAVVVLGYAIPLGARRGGNIPAVTTPWGARATTDPTASPNNAIENLGFRMVADPSPWPNASSDVVFDIQPILPETGTDTLGLAALLKTGNYGSDPQSLYYQRGMAYFVSTSNFRLSTLQGALFPSLGLRNFTLTPGAHPFTDAGRQAPLSWADVTRASQAAVMSALNPADRELNGANLSSRLCRLPNRRNMWPDWARIVGDITEGTQPNPASAETVMTSGARALASPQWVSNPMVVDGEHCCSVNLTLFQGAPDVEYNLNLTVDALLDAVVPPTSGLPKVIVPYDIHAAQLLQQASLMPGYATAHSFKNYFKGALKRLKSVGKHAFHSALGLAKDAAVAELVELATAVAL